MLSLQWNLNNVHTQPIGISLHEYLFGFKIESPADRLVGNAMISANVLEQRFIREYLRRDVQFASLEANVLAKCYYDTMYCWEEFEVGDQVWLRMDKVYRPKDKPNKYKILC